jgi:hypothetical protein
MIWALIAWMILVSGTPAGAHKGAGEGPPDAVTWVRQALAFLDLKPPDIREAAERLDGALKAKDTEGVDLALVRETVEALKAKKPGEASAALTRALLPPPPPRPQASRGTRPPGPPPQDADEEVSAHYIPGAPLKALEPRFGESPGEYALLAVGATLIALGLLALRWTEGHGAERLR